MSLQNGSSVHASSLLDSATTSQQGVILSTLLSYAAGDAFAVAYEYLPERIPVDIGAIGTRANWPAGGVSDDTLLSLLTIHAVRVGDPAESADTFLRDVLAAVPGLRGTPAGTGTGEGDSGPRARPGG